MGDPPQEDLHAELPHFFPFTHLLSARLSLGTSCILGVTRADSGGDDQAWELGSDTLLMTW